ncbi:MAG: 30S ribosomal protein S16 [Bacteroidales bacterium]|jgi:small subunit ribosomal protein S16|nr:30S ribosomal protein S16 [Bacteroidales bacterium]
MAVKIRLQRFGKKGQPVYHIIVADGRAPRDGRFIEKIGTYNPMPAQQAIILDMDRALYWVQVGAVPTDTVKAILSNKGVMLRNHLLKGVQKGALTLDQAEAKFDAWVLAKESKQKNEVTEKIVADRNKSKAQLEQEVKIKEERLQALAKKKAAESAVDAPQEEVASEESNTEETPAAE